MITDLTIMIYVKDVNKSADFWTKIGFEEVMRQELGGGFETVLLMYGEMGAGIQLYDLEYIENTQPQQAGKKPSLLFSADYIDDVYEAAKSVSPDVSEIQPYGDQSVFTFSDLDGNVFTLMGELVDVPDTEENMADFDENVKRLTALKLDDVDSLTEPAYLFFGRRTCPWSRHLAKDLADLTTPMYFVDTEGSEATHSVRLKYQVKTVPTVIKRASTGAYVKWDKKEESIFSFVGEA